MEFTFLFPPVIFAQVFNSPFYFELVIITVLLGAGALAWLVAAVLGFTRARAFGSSAKWFAFSAACLVIYHLQFLVFAVVASSNPNSSLSFYAFFNLFIFLGAICAIIGFKRLSDPT